jgi:DNA-binding IscR family transcriptional regulator
MDEILELNRQYFEKKKNQNINLIYLEKIIKKLAKHKIVKIA